VGTVRLGVRLAGKTTAIGKSAAAGQTADDGPTADDRPTADHGPAAAIEEAADSGSPRPRPPVRSRSTYLRAGRGFARLTTVPPLLVIAWLLPAIPLLAAGRFLPVPMVLISAPLAAILMVATLRVVPGRWPGLVRRAADAEEQRPPRAWAAWCGLGGTLVIGAGFAAWQMLLNSPQIIVLRDPGAMTQLGYWIAEHGLLPIPQSLAAFGGPHPGLTFAAAGFSQQPGGLVPQFSVGLPMILAAGFWAHGTAGAALISPILGAFAVLTFGGLAGRLAGPLWAPPAALVLALTLPEQYTSRSAFAEPLVQVLIFGGICLVIDSLIATSPAAQAAGRIQARGRAPGLRPDWLAPATAAAAIGGLALGLASLASIGSLATVVPGILFLGPLVAGRRSQAVPFGCGLIVGAGCGLAGGYLLAPSYLRALGPSLRDLGFIAAGLIIVVAVGVALAWRGPVRRRTRRMLSRWPLSRLPEALAVVWVAALVGFVIRPYVQTVHSDASRSTAAYVGALQRALDLPPDPSRLYSEHSLYWVIWYIGLPAVLLGWCGIALLGRRCLRALMTWRDPDAAARIWALPLLIIGWGVLSVLWRPGTVPDQPWASRRLVPVVLPGLILCAIWVASWLAARARDRGAGAGAVATAAACFVVALALPTALATFGFGLTFAPLAGAARSATGGLALNRAGPGQTAAVNDVCGTLSASTSVVILDRVAAEQFGQVIRGMCGVPAGIMAGASPSAVQAVLSGITAAGRRPVLIGSGSAEFARYGFSPSKVLDLTTTQDAHDLTQPPTAPWQISYVLWESTPGSSIAGA
jgi:hypothetical protein